MLNVLPLEDLRYKFIKLFYIDVQFGFNAQEDEMRLVQVLNTNTENLQ